MQLRPVTRMGDFHLTLVLADIYDDFSAIAAIDRCFRYRSRLLYVLARSH